MKTRGLVLLTALAVSVALGAAAPTAARVLDHVTFPDAAGDGDPDITGVAVASNAAGGITFVTQIANRTELAENEFVFVLIDSDNNAATGEQPNGVDYMLQLDRTDAALFRWNGTAWADTQSRTVYGYVFKGFRIGVMQSDLALTSNELHFWVETQAGEKFDEAPNGEFLVYNLSANPLRLRIMGAVALAKTVRVGKQFVVGMQTHRSDLDEVTSAGIVRCAAKVGKRAVKVTAGFPEDVALCAGVAPKLAKGKTLNVTISLELDGARVSRTVPIKVR
jgi:hypothetical protein